VEVAGKALLEWSYGSFHSLRASGLVGKRDFYVVLSPEIAEKPELIEVISKMGINTLVTTGPTRGPAETATQAISQLLRKGEINKDEAVIFSDCDHYIHPGSLLRAARRLSMGPDSSVVLFETTKDSADLSWCFLTPKPDFLCGSSLVEKPSTASGIDPSLGILGLYGFSNLNGFEHESPDDLGGRSDSTGPVFMSDLVNWRLKQGDNLYVQRIARFVPLGTHAQIKSALEQESLAEGFKESATLFIDLDGTLFVHDAGFFSHNELYSDELVLLDPQIPGKLGMLFDEGFTIILTTSRPEIQRPSLLSSLSDLGVPFDQLIMGIGGGPRYIINDTKPSLVSFKTASGYSIERNTKDVLRIFDQILEDSRLVVLSDFPGESGSITQRIGKSGARGAFIRKTSQPTEDSRSLITYQAHWYRHIGQLLPQAVPPILNEETASLDSRISLDMEFIGGLTEFGKALQAHDHDGRKQLIHQFGDLMTVIYGVHSSLDATPLTELGVILENKALPGLEVGLGKLGFSLTAPSLPLVFNGRQVANPYPLLKALADEDRHKLTRLEKAGSSRETLVHGDPTLSNIKLSSSGQVVLLDPIGSRVSPGFRYNGFDLGRAHALWDKVRIDLSARLGYEDWPSQNMPIGTAQEGYEVNFKPTLDSAVTFSINAYWDPWLPESEEAYNLALALTLARILPYKVNAGKKTEALLLLGFLGEIIGTLELPKNG
jgi:hypothetical protein